MFLQSPVEFPRTRVLRAAARAVTPGGLLLIVEHASAAPWSWADPDTAFPTPEQSLETLDLDPSRWHSEFVGAPSDWPPARTGSPSPTTSSRSDASPLRRTTRL